MQKSKETKKQTNEMRDNKDYITQNIRIEKDSSGNNNELIFLFTYVQA
jgi:hypothetical protein